MPIAQLRAACCLAATVASWMGVTCAATAGTYDINACGTAPGGANHAWTSPNAASDTVNVNAACPPGGAWDGLGVYDALSAPHDSAAEAVAQWTLRAPAGVRIERVQIYRYI